MGKIMFKAARVLQVAAILALLAGCASSRTAETASATPTQGSASVAGGIAGSAPPAVSRPPRPDLPNGFLAPGGILTAEAQSFAREVAQARGVPLQHVEELLRQAQYNATVARLMSPTTTRVRRSWVTYRQRFVEPIRIKAGTRFWQEQRAALDEAYRQYGVPPAIIVAIIGVETIYGRQTGNFRILDSLATLAFRYPDPSRPERSQLFRDQLADLIQLDNRNELDAATATGSYAGALGLPQFMPGSLLRFALDGDHDGHVDLLNSPGDAILSVANFLRQHGWQPGLPVFAPVTLPSNAASLVKGGLEPTYTWDELKREGATASAPANANWSQGRLGIVNLVDEPRNTVEYRTGTANFFAITHYNRSYFYAASVADLAQALAAQAGQPAP